MGRLRARSDVAHWKARTLDLSALLAVPTVAADTALRRTTVPSRPQAELLDHAIMRLAGEAMSGVGPPALVELPITNADRAVGARLSGELVSKHGRRGLPAGTIAREASGLGRAELRGVPCQRRDPRARRRGQRRRCQGFVGGTVVVYPPAGGHFEASESIIAGNVAAYGATSGDLFVSGVAGERFAVRNSGARAVVEGLGDHGCEYMTGGVVVVLGPTGRNFAAGMSGGVAYLFDPKTELRTRCNLETVELESLVDESDIWLAFTMIEEHVQWTGSKVGTRLLDNWPLIVPQFLKVMPTEYKRVLQARRSSPSQRPRDRRAPPRAEVR